MGRLKLFGAATAVLDVGDGACSVYLNGRDWNDVMVVDCGVWKRSARGPAATLDRMLNQFGILCPSTVVITHFDADHWRGLMEYARLHAGSHAFKGKRVELRYPQLPRPVEWVAPMVSALISISGGAPVLTPARLERAWLNTGADVELLAVSQKDIFEGGGRTWDVLWPPNALDAEIHQSVIDLFEQARALAAEIPELESAFARAYGAWWAELDDDVAPDISAEGLWSEIEMGLQQGAVDGATPSDSRSSTIYESGYERWLEECAVGADESRGGKGPVQRLSSEQNDRVRNVGRRLQRLNNSLSLVLSATDSSVLNFGDVEGWGLADAVSYHRSRYGPRMYDIVLAPHHGTADADQETRSYFPPSNVLVAQNGPSHAQNFKGYYADRSVYVHFTTQGSLYVNHGSITTFSV